MTHLALPYAAARLAGRPSPCPRPWLVVFCLGAVLPDVGRAVNVAWPYGPFQLLGGFFHAPLVLLVLCAGLVFVFPARRRLSYLGWLLLGAGVHLIFDAGQRQLGGGGYFWFFPFSWRRGDLGLFWSDATVLAAPYFVALGLAVEAVVQWRARRRCSPPRRARPRP